MPGHVFPVWYKYISYSEHDMSNVMHNIIRIIRRFHVNYTIDPMIIPMVIRRSSVVDS